MKKFLLSLAAMLLVAVGMSAESVVFDFATETYGLTRETDNAAEYIAAGTKLTENGGVNVTLNKTEGKNGWRLWTDGLRVYKNSGSAIQLNAGANKITGIQFEMAKTGVITAYKVGEAAEVAVSDKAFNVVCNGSDINLALTVTANGAIAKMTVELNGEGGGDTPVDPEPNPDPEVKEYTVAEVLAMDVASLSGANAWVKGYVVGSFNGKSTDDFTAEAGANASVSNLAIAATADVTDVTKMVAVQLPAGDVRTALNLKDNAAMLGKEVNLYGTLEKYFGTYGLKNVTKYDVTGGVPEVEVKETATLTSFIEEQDENNYYKILGAVTVVYQSGNYLFITDGTSDIEVYGKLSKTYKNGDQLTGIIGKFGYYMNMPQMAPKAESFGDATEGTAVTPAETTLDKVQLAQYVTVKNVKVVSDGDKWNVTDGTTTLQLFNRFNIEGIKGLEGTTITGIGAIYDETKQLFPITIEGGTETGDTPEPPVVEPGDGIVIMANQLDPAAATTVNGFTFNMSQNDGATAPAYYESTADIRLYAKNTLTISGGAMSKIVFTLKNATYRYTTFAPSVGALNPAQAEGDTEITWEGNANEVTFTVGDIATLGTENTKPGQIKFTQVTIYGEAGAISEIRFDENGSMVIYNLRGQRLSAPVKGINIINGKKVLVK